MEIIQKPDSLSLLGNLKKFLISSNAEVDFSLSVSIDGADVSLLQESYTPDSSGNISIDIREVCGQYLKTNLPSDNVFLQSDALRTFTATIGSSSWSFTVVNASVRNLTLSALEYLQYNFLTLQPQSKQVSWHSPEYLTYYFTEQADVQAKFYLKSGGTEIVTVATISPTPEGGSGTIQLVNKVYTINTTLSRLMALSSHDTEDLQGIVDVWVQGSVSRLSYIQRYVYAPSTGEEHHYFAVNSLGGIDTFTFIGEQKITGEIEHQAAENDDKKIAVTSGGQRKYRQNTGYLGEASSEWLWEFLHSSRQWVVAAASAEEIVVVSSSLSQGDMTNLNSSSFDFLLARDGGLLPKSRRDETFPDITVPSPVSDLFFLNPRIIDFPAAPSDAELVFPVQTPYSNEWSYLTLQELQERLSIAASLNHTHRNLSVLQALGESNGQLTYRGVVIGSGGGISLPITISDVEGLSTALNNKANISHSHSWNDITDKPHFVDFTSEQTITGLKHMHHLDILLSMAVPQAAPANPEADKIYFWLDENGNSASAPSGGSVANVYPLTITKNNVSWLVYNPGTQAETVNLDIPTKVSQLQNDSGYLTQHQSLSNYYTKTEADGKFLTSHQSLADYATKQWVEDKGYLTSHQSLSGYATESWVQQQGYLTSHQSLSGYATESWVQQQGYLTSHQSLSGYATESWVNTQIDSLNLDSILSGIASNSARISTLEDRVKIDMPYRLSDLQNDLSLDDLPDGSTRKLANYVQKSGDTMTGTLTGPLFVGAVDAYSKYFSVPQAAPSNPETGKIYFWLDENGNSASAPSGGSVANVYPLTITKNNVSWLVYNPGTQAETVNLDIPTKVSQLQNDSGYLTQHQSLSNYYTKTEADGKFLTSHQSLADYATKQWVEDKGYLTSHQSLSGYATESWVQQQGYLTSHQSLSGYATESWVQQQGYLTSHQSLSGYATESWVNTQIDSLNLDSILSGIASNSARISTLEDRVKIDMPYRLSDLQNDILSAWALASAKPGYTLDEVSDGSNRKLSDYLPLTGGAMANTNLVTKLNAELLNGWGKDRYLPASLYAPSKGILVTTEIDASANTMIYMRIEGNNYTNNATGPIFTILQTYINSSGTAFSRTAAYNMSPSAPSTIYLLVKDGKVCFWWAYGAASRSYFVTVMTSYPSARTKVNRVTSITDAALPADATVTLSKTVTAKSVMTRVGSTDNAITRFDGTSGDVQDSLVTIADNGDMIFPSGATLDLSVAQVAFPTAAPANPVAGKVYFWIDLTGNSVNS